MSLGSQIKELRATMGLTLPALAAKAGVSKGYLWKIEQSAVNRFVRVRPSSQTISKIAAVLRVSVEDLMESGRSQRGDRTMVAHHIVPRKPHLPKSLVKFVEESVRRGEKLSDDEIEMLAGIRYRGQVPNSVEDWGYIFQSIIRTIGAR